MPARNDTLQSVDTLAVSLRALGTAVSAGLIGFAFIDRAFRYLRVNERYSAIAARSVADHIGETIDDVHGPISAITVREAVERVYAGEPIVRDVLVHSSDHDRYSCSFFRVPPGRGPIDGCSVLASPVTELDRDAILREESRQRFKSLFDFHPCAIFSLDLQGCFVDANPMCEVISGYSIAELLGNPFVPMVAPKYLESTFEHFAFAAQGQAQNYEIEFLNKAGERVPIHVTNVPIYVDDAIVGVYGIVEDISERRRGEYEREMLRKLADERAKELAREFQREHQVAESLQRAPLVKPPSIFFDSLDVETVYKSALDEAQVGGDFYDAFSLANGNVALVVGDVSGKGLTAATHTAEVKFTLRAYLRENIDPGFALYRLNSVFSNYELGDGENRFVCIAVAVVNTNTGQIDISIAGCETPLILHASGGTEMLGQFAPPIGVDSRSEYDTVSANLNPGDLVVLATDGVTEARPRPQADFLGMNGLIDIAKIAAANSSLYQVGSTIMTELERFASEGLHDDVCILLARFAPR